MACKSVLKTKQISSVYHLYSIVQNRKNEEMDIFGSDFCC